MVYSKTINCDTKNLSLLRKFVSNVLSQNSIPEATIKLIVLAVDEVCANRIIHTPLSSKKDAIKVSVSPVFNDNELLVEIKDNGACFDISSYDTPDIKQVIKEKKMGGMGLILVKRIMDRIHVEQIGEENVCRLYKSY